MGQSCYITRIIQICLDKQYWFYPHAINGFLLHDLQLIKMFALRYRLSLLVGFTNFGHSSHMHKFFYARFQYWKQSAGVRYHKSKIFPKLFISCIMEPTSGAFLHSRKQHEKNYQLESRCKGEIREYEHMRADPMRLIHKFE